MRKRGGGFTKFMRKLDGVKDNDNISSTERTWAGVRPGYVCVLGWLRGDYDTQGYLDRVFRLDPQERSAAFELRSALGLSIYPMGMHHTDGVAYRQAIEHLGLNQAGEQQDDVQATVGSGSTGDNTPDPDVIEQLREAYRILTSCPSPSNTRSG